MFPLPGIHAFLLASDIPVLHVWPIVYHPYHWESVYLSNSILSVILSLKIFLSSSLLQTLDSSFVGLISLKILSWHLQHYHPCRFMGLPPPAPGYTQLFEGLGLCPHPQSQPSNVEVVAPRFSYGNNTWFSPFHMKPFVSPSSFPYWYHWKQFLNFLL